MHNLKDLERCGFDDVCFKTIYERHKSETMITDLMLNKLPLFIDVNCMEYILSILEEKRDQSKNADYDDEFRVYR